MNFKTLTACVSALSICISGWSQNIEHHILFDTIFATDLTEIDELRYIVLDDGTIEISGYEGYDENVELVIPNEIDQKKVTSIGEGAFSGHKNLVSVTIPSSVTNIGICAFNCCSKLKNVIIPDSVTTIGTNAFWECKSLSTIIIPNSVTSIGSGAFNRCSNLRNITIPGSVTSIGDYTFSGCKLLQDITFQEGLESIGYGAFFACTYLTNITLPSSLTTIKENAFWDCGDLTSITIPDSVTNVERNAFLNCRYLTIYGNDGSYIQDYAKKNYIKFKLIEDSSSQKCDIDNNGVISTSDFVGLIRYLIHNDEKIDLSSADINGDGEVNINDAVELKMILMK